MRSAARRRLAHLAARRRDDAARRRHDALFANGGGARLRSGYAFAQGAYLHGAPPERHWVWESRRAWLWGVWLPLACLVCGLLIWALGLGCLADLSLADAAPDGAQSRTAARPRDAGAVPGAGALSRGLGPDQVHARPPARPPGAPHRIQVTPSCASPISSTNTQRSATASSGAKSWRSNGRGSRSCASRCAAGTASSWTRKTSSSASARAMSCATARSRLLLAVAAHAAHAAGALAAGARAGVAHEPPRRAAAARASRLSGRGLPHRALAARGRRPARACAFRHQLGRGRDAGACAGRAALELHRPRPGGIRQGASSSASPKRSGAARLWWRSAHMGAASSTGWWSTSTGPRCRSCIAGWSRPFTRRRESRCPRRGASFAWAGCASKRGSCCWSRPRGVLPRRAWISSWCSPATAKCAARSRR